MFNTKLKLIYLLHVQNVPAYAPRQQFLKKVFNFFNQTLTESIYNYV